MTGLEPLNGSPRGEAVSATPEQIADAEERAKALLPALMTLMEYGIPADVQELLVRGSPHLGIRAGALQAAITSAQAERVRVLEGALRGLFVRLDHPGNGGQHVNYFLRWPEVETARSALKGEA